MDKKPATTNSSNNGTRESRSLVIFKDKAGWLQNTEGPIYNAIKRVLVAIMITVAINVSSWQIVINTP